MSIRSTNPITRRYPDNESDSNNDESESSSLLLQPDEEHADSGPSSVEDLIEAAGTSGWRNYLIYFFCAWSTFVNPMHTMSYQFLGATPAYWCQVDELTSANWTTSQIIALSVPKENLKSQVESCDVYGFDYTIAAQIGFERSMEKFNQSTSKRTLCDKRTFNASEPLTVVSMWDLVCDRRKIYSTTQAIVYAGTLVGSLLIGGLLDYFGRKKVYIWNIPCYLTIGILTAFSPNVKIYIFLKFLESMIGSVYYFVGLLLTYEMCQTKQRTYLGALNGLPWAIGYMTLPAIAYYVRPFFYLQIAVTLPALTLLPSIWVLLESHRWLISKQRFEEAIAVLEILAKNNGHKLPSKAIMLRIMTDTYQKRTLKGDSGATRKLNLRKLYDLWLTNRWMWKLAILCFSWFSVSMVYYGVSLNPPNLHTGKYMYIFLGGLLEIPAYIAIWVIGAYFGRKKPIVVFFICCSVAIYGAMSFSLFATKENTYEGWLTAFSLAGKFAITAAFQLVWMYTIELLPTRHRSVMIGEASVCARIGSISSPYIVDLLGDYIKWTPSAIFGTVSLVAASLMVFMPETSNLPLPESIP